MQQYNRVSEKTLCEIDNCRIIMKTQPEKFKRHLTENRFIHCNLHELAEIHKN